MMLVDTELLPALRADIERRHPDCEWWQAILAQYDRRQISGFSEFETYGNWFVDRHPEKVTYEYWFNRSLPRRALAGLDALLARWGGSVRSASFHFHEL